MHEVTFFKRVAVGRHEASVYNQSKCWQLTILSHNPKCDHQSFSIEHDDLNTYTVH